MSVRKLSLLGLPVLALLSSCGVEANAVYADVRWWATCPTVNPWACPATKKHDFQQFDGDIVEGTLYRASCTAVESNNQLSVSFTVQDGEDALDVRGIVTGVNGGSVLSGGCSVQMTESGNSFEGDCGAATPSAAQPCQIQNVAVDRNDPDGKSVTVRMSCDRLPWDAQPTLGFNVRDAANTVSPAELRLANCIGL
jgi:hypothetical protein